MVAGGRIPGYSRYAGRLTAEEYVEKVVRGELSDPSLNAHLKAGYRVLGVHMGYLRDDQVSNYATFLDCRIRTTALHNGASPHHP